jgi:hypothetical protein
MNVVHQGRATGLNDRTAVGVPNGKLLTPLRFGAAIVLFVEPVNTTSAVEQFLLTSEKWMAG